MEKYYQILWIECWASEEEIKNYRNELSHWDKSFNNIWQGLLTDRTNHSIEG